MDSKSIAISRDYKQKFITCLQKSVASGIKEEKRIISEIDLQQLNKSAPKVSQKLFVSEVDDDVYTYLNKIDHNVDELQKPWKQNPYYFQTVHVSILAMNKMTTHAISGGSIEIMGMLLGYHRGSDIYILDCYPLPVQGTESRVNPQNDSYEFMLQYLTKVQQSGLKRENIIGWYHSHPGFGCWLSGIDVQTQKLHQGFEDPYVAIVIDPHKSIEQGTIDIGAFRTFADNCKPSFDGLEDNENMGWHSREYYPLDVKMFVNKLDKLMLECIANEEVSTSSISPLVPKHVNDTYNSLKIAKHVNSLVDKIDISDDLKTTSESNQKQANTEDEDLYIKATEIDTFTKPRALKQSECEIGNGKQAQKLVELIKAGISADLDAYEQLQNL